jgi:hypothetical protein
MHSDEHRESRKLAFEAAQTLTDKAKIEAIKNDAAQSFYRVFGKRLTPLMVERGVESILLSDEATVTIKSSFRQLPVVGDRAGWDRLTRKTAESDVWLKANLVSSDENLRAALKEECLANLSGVKRMTLYRQGTLDKHIESFIAEHIDAKLEALR